MEKRRRFQFYALLGLTIVSAVTEVVSLGAIVPFISILTQPEIVYQHPMMSHVNEAFNFRAADELFLPLTILFAISAMCAGGFRLLLLWLSIRLSNATGADLSVEVYRRTLYQPYSIHVSRNSSEIISGITQKVSTVTSVLISVVTVITSFVLFISLLATLVFIDPVIATLSLLSFGSCYAIIAKLTRNRLLENSTQIAEQQTYVVKALQEGLGAIRDVLLDNTQNIYCGIYKKAIYKLQRSSGENKYISQGPRFLMESIGMVLIAMLAYIMSFQPGGVSAALPVLGAMALGAQRILPLLQQLYGNWSVVTGSKAAIEDVLMLLNQEMPEQKERLSAKKIQFNNNIEFSNVSFRYNEDAPWVLNNINFTIEAGSKTGIIGETGSGKSTLLDLLMALLEPVSGDIIMDGQAMEFGQRAMWHQNIAHVPQAIYLSDATISENIAFGVPKEKIDMNAVCLAAEQAQLLDLINERKEGFNSIVGERGIRLSGGQRQRIGIARALYKKARILVFDEATSALDSKTEGSVMEAIGNLDSSLTILIIAHRITTLQNCDRVIQLEDGKIKSIESYELTMSKVPEIMSANHG